MEIAIVGTGYVGLVAGVCFADVGHRVICVDKVQDKIDQLKEGRVPIYEPGLEDLLRTTRNRLEFTTDIRDAVRRSKVVFIAVGTPEKEDGSADLGPTLAVVASICEHANEDKVLVLKSTVPIGTAKQVREYCKAHAKFNLDIVSNPEFLKEGAAVDDFLRPDRVIIGCEGTHAASMMGELYEPFVRNGHPIYFMDNTSAEMTKYAANAFLSVKISFINELALLADKVGADINQVRKGFTSDSRINPAFFYPGVGYGGSCFPKDVSALVRTGEKYAVPMQVVKAADQVNDRQKLLFYDRAKEVFGSLEGKTFAFWGLSFKPRTDDVREAPALYLLEKFVAAGAKVKAYDPAAMKTAREATKASFIAAESAMDAVKGADALFLITEWNEFKSPDLVMLKARLKSPVVFDGRNILDPIKMKEHGFQYFSVGRQRLVN